MQDSIREAIRAAAEAAGSAYANYSGSLVGAAVVAADGTIVEGCNIENASYGLSMCAERVALFRAYASGVRDIRQVVVYVPGEEIVTPCGACRQVIAELAPVAEVHCACGAGEVKSYRAGALLPDPFASPD